MILQKDWQSNIAIDYQMGSKDTCINRLTASSINKNQVDNYI